MTENIALDTGFTQESTVELTEPSGELAELNVILRANFGEGGTAAVNIKPSGAAMPHVDFNSGYFAEASADLLMIGKVSEDQEFPQFNPHRTRHRHPTGKHTQLFSDGPTSGNLE